VRRGRLASHPVSRSAAQRSVDPSWPKASTPKAIQELLRHSSIQLTMDTYGHLFDEIERETADKMDQVLRGKPAENQPYKVSDKASNPGEANLTSCKLLESMVRPA